MECGIEQFWSGEIAVYSAMNVVVLSVMRMNKCGHSTTHTEISSFKLVDGPKSNGKRENVVKAAAGITFSLVLTSSGKGGVLSYLVVCGC